MKRYKSVGEDLEILDAVARGYGGGCDELVNLQFKRYEAKIDLQLPFPGRDSKHIQVHAFPERIVIKERGREMEFPFDSEYLTILAWTVHCGMFHLIMQWRVPEKYHKPMVWLPSDPSEFVKQFWSEFNGP